LKRYARSLNVWPFGKLPRNITAFQLFMGDFMWQTYWQPTTLDHALALLDQHAEQARVVSGGTDVIVELQRGVKPTTTLIDITRLSELDYVRLEGDQLRIGGLATHNDIIASADCVARALPLAQACWEVGAPQIRTRGTIAGNLITASPANDTIPPLMAMGAEVVLVSSAGERVVPLESFYTGFRKTVLRPNELLREIRVPALQAHQRGIFLKLGLRRAQAISVIDLAIVLSFEHDDPSTATITDARIALGCLAPTVVRAPTAERFLIGKTLSEAVNAEAGRLACDDAAPIDDLRGSASYRRTTLANLIADGLARIAADREDEGWPSAPVLLETTPSQLSSPGNSNEPLTLIDTTINGQAYRLRDAHTKTLLDALREDAQLTGTKEGCAEGECGACTVWINGQAVMACLTPAAQAHGAVLTTIEGLANTAPNDANLHPLQRTFIEKAAVQCGYCIPGMLMAGAKLLDEHRKPDLEQIQTALSGNICRCTGYRKILDAVQAAAEEPRVSGGQS
jgi:xanthine dehydrogenase iron-sulfur cluster and FAD-binding subunit A